MRVAMVSEHANPLDVVGSVDAGGQNVHVAALAEHLAKYGVEVDIYTRRSDTNADERVQMSDGVTVVHVQAGPAEPIDKDELWPYMSEFGNELVKHWMLRRPDVVHAHFWMSGHAALHAGRCLDVPVVQTFHALGTVKRRHQGDADRSPGSRLGVERRIGSIADMIIATCRDEVSELCAMGVDIARVRVIPCGVDLTQFHPNGVAAPRTSGSKRVLSVGRLVERKGIEDVVRAIADVPEAELVIAGGVERARLDENIEVGRLRSIAEEIGVSDRIEWRGCVPRGDVPALMRSCDVVVCTPWYEPFGIVPLEAMACGVPVVASSVGGLLDTVDDGVTGIHVEPRNHGEIASALRRLFEDDALRCRMRLASTIRARRYDWNEIALRTRSVYAELAGRSTSSFSVMEGVS